MESIVETPRVPGRFGFVIEFLTSKVRRSSAAALGQMDKPTSGARRCAGTEKKIGRAGSSDCAERCRAQRRVSGRGCRNEVDGSSAVMAEREADLAIVVSPSGSFVARCRGRRQESGRAGGREWKRVVVPGEQGCLEQDCKNAQECRPASRSRHLRLVRPHRYR